MSSWTIGRNTLILAAIVVGLVHYDAYRPQVWSALAVLALLLFGIRALVDSYKMVARKRH